MSDIDLRYLVYNRDDHGNRKVVMLENGGSKKFCWNLTLEQAKLVIQRLLEPQTKQHGQMHDMLSYPKGTLAAFLEEQKLLY